MNYVLKLNQKYLKTSSILGFKMTIIARGAEAILKKEGEFLIKERIRKGYRLPQLDEKLRRSRTKREIELMRIARRSGIKTPQIFSSNENTIKMAFIDGIKVKDILDKKPQLCKKIGISIANMHKFNIIHGDLTTSNMIFKDDEIYFIDFSLGFQSQKIEDKAIDLYLLFEAITSSHEENLWKLILNAYEKNYDKEKKIIKRLLQIEKRGRYRER